MRQFVSLRDGIAHGTVHAVSSSLTSRHWLDVHGAASPAAFSITSERVRLSSSCCDRMRVLETFEGRLDALGQVDGRLA